jgi:hypothetical protein
MKKGEPRIALGVPLLDEMDIASIQIEEVDGQNRWWNTALSFLQPGLPNWLRHHIRLRWIPRTDGFKKLVAQAISMEITATGRPVNLMRVRDGQITEAQGYVKGGGGRRCRLARPQHALRCRAGDRAERRGLGGRRVHVTISFLLRGEAEKD